MSNSAPRIGDTQTGYDGLRYRWTGRQWEPIWPKPEGYQGR